MMLEIFNVFWIVAEHSHARRSKKDVAKTGNRERGTSTENGKMKKMGTKKRIGNEVTYRARAQVRFSAHYSLSCLPLSFPAPRFAYFQKKANRKTSNKIFCEHIQNVERCNRTTKGKKYTKKRDARAKFLFS